MGREREREGGRKKTNEKEVKNGLNQETREGERKGEREER